MHPSVCVSNCLLCVCVLYVLAAVRFDTAAKEHLSSFQWVKPAGDCETRRLGGASCRCLPLCPVPPAPPGGPRFLRGDVIECCACRKFCVFSLSTRMPSQCIFEQVKQALHGGVLTVQEAREIVNRPAW